MKTLKVAFIYNTNASWVLRDLSILNNRYVVFPRKIESKNYIAHLLLGFNDVWRADAAYFWFGSLSFLPLMALAKILSKKVLIVSGGFDVAAEHDLNYGAYTQNWLRRILRDWIFFTANKIFAVSKFNYDQVVKNVAKINKNLHLIEHGFSSYPTEVVVDSKSRKKSVVMICNANESAFLLKGIDQLVLIAKQMSDIQFVHMGCLSEEVLKKIHPLPSNLTVRGSIQYNSPSYINIISSCKIALQLSRYESFGAAIVDATLLGCFPIVYDSGALPEIVNDIGRVVPFGNLQSLEDSIREMMNKELDCLGLAKLIQEKFDIDMRANKIYSEIDSMLS